jgi:SNF2 family DNA or RNA helicase
MIKKTEDFIKWYNNKNNSNKPTYLIIGKETFKLSYAKEPAFRKIKRYVESKEMDEWYKTHGYYTKRDYMYTTKKRLKEVLVCPDCGTPLKNPNRTSEDVFFEESDYKTINKGNYKCSKCNSVLWSATYNKTKKTSVIDFIHRKGIVFDSVIVDEAHESNNSGSIIGNATRTLIREHSKKVIALSGTSNNGYASSLHNFLMSVCPNKLKSDDCLDVKDFIQKYGTLQAVTDINNEEKRYYYQRGKSEIKDSEYKEIEGINPIVFTKYLAENSIFATLDDLGKDLPPLNEIYVPVRPDEEQLFGEGRLFNDIKSANAFNAKMYVDSIIKHWVNNPYNWDSITIQGSEMEKEIQPTNLDLEVLPKENELLHIVKKEISEGRKVWIYTEFNNGGEYMKGEKLPNKLEKLLKAEGIKVFQLKASTSTYERKDIIEANKDKYDVFISNPRLVNVGINLVFCPTYIFYMPSYLVNVTSQASRRGYRANSILENRIYHLYYKDTWEDTIIKRYQRKLAESKAINGQFDVTLENDENIRTASKLSVNINRNI